MKNRRRERTRSGRIDYSRLEGRRMLAGNVRVAFNDGAVFLRGDNSDNQLEAVRVFGSNNQSDLVIRGIDGTTINGQLELTIPETAYQDSGRLR